ncbi:hypothetical protein [Pedobacter insulae]|uniref:Uncharacterized protein n=1 Tax=Pedobacter insulae TaxID=414048 RepID=A0A1I2VJ39_9SPHI|nr:hypothetical protein [Pedobacter insulae]SFG89182.1 hypothetical protein SAMN04489864_10366 [Pedobacter insulae]
MENLLAWRKGLFDSNYQLYANGEIKGSLVFSSWKNNARGIALKNYYFTSEGFLHPVTKIRDEHHNQIGVITYNALKLKATVTFNSLDHASWSYTNSWLSQWVITNHKDKQIQYYSESTSGTVHSDTDDELMLLSGFFIREFFSRGIIIILLILLIPILMRTC